MVDEQELLQRVNRLEESALAEVFDTYYRPIYRYVYHHVGHRETAENLAADVFTRLLERLKTEQGPREHLQAWLYRVAHNLIVDESRRGAHRDHDPIDDIEGMADDLPETAARAEQAILTQQARLALDRIPHRQREVIMLRFLEGLQSEEVAQILGMSVGAVKALQSRGLVELRKHLANLGAMAEGLI